jgi:hypothetical protein
MLSYQGLLRLALILPVSKPFSLNPLDQHKADHQSTGPSGYHFGAIPEPHMGPFLNPTETLRSGHITSEWGTHHTDGTNIFPGPGSWPPGPQLFINSTNSGANHSLISLNPSTSYMYSLADASEHGPEQALRPLSSDVSLSPYNRGSIVDEYPSRNIPGGYSVGINHRCLARHHTTNFEIKYFCTVCGDKPFKDKDTWRRHERCHYPDIEYVCSPSGPVLFTPDGERCAFCNAEDPDPGHLAGHKAQSCYEKKEKWARKDTFVRHLRTQHGVSDASRQVEMWSIKPPARVLGCGFCVMSFDNTTSRLSHIAQHMEDGCTTTHWDRCNVVRSLLSQPRVALDWQAVLREYVGEQHPLPIIWSNEIASGLQKRLEDGEESGQELALAAIYQSSLYVVENPFTTSRDEPRNGSGSYRHDISTMNQSILNGWRTSSWL